MAQAPATFQAAVPATDDVAAVDALFARHGLERGRVVAVAAAGDPGAPAYERFGEAIASLCRELDLQLVAIGSATDSDVNHLSAERADVPIVDLCGALTPSQAIELLRRCRLAVTPQTGLVPLMTAAGVPHVLLLGGGAFGRFAPASPLTTITCLPIDCYGCGWKCRYPTPYCVTSVEPRVVEAAAWAAVVGTGDKPRAYVQDRSMWFPQQGMPGWAWFHNLLDRATVDLFAVSSTAADTLTLPVAELRWPQRLRRRVDDPKVAPSHRAAAQQRQQLALECVRTAIEQANPAAQGTVGQRLGSAWQAAWRDVPAEPNEGPIVDEILSGLARGPGDPFAVRYRLVAPLYFRGYELPALPDLDPLPPQWVEAVVRDALAAPPIFVEIGEEERYADYLTRWLAMLNEALDRHPNDPAWQRVAVAAAESVNVISAYFAAGDLTELMRGRARIIERALRGAGFKIEHDFPTRDHGGRKPRVGIVQMQFSFHTETYSALPVFEHLDRGRYEVFLYALRENGTEIEKYCRSRADHFRVLPADVAGQAAAIRADDLDYLFIATNVAAVTHPLTVLAAHRLARKQLTSLNSPVTTGFAAMDAYVLGRGARSPATVDGAYTERPAFIDGPGFCLSRPTRPPASNAAVPTREQMGIATTAPVFVSGANFYKINPALRRTWARLLARVQGSYLILFPFGPSWSNVYAADAFVRDFARVLVEQGARPEQLKIIPPVPSETDVPRLLKLGDVYVDSFPYSGAVSLNEALEAGLPTVVMDAVPQRFGQAAAALRDLGLNEFIAADEEAYLQLAIDLATDPAKRQEAKGRIRAALSRTPRFLDPKFYAGQIAQVFDELNRPPKTGEVRVVEV